MEHVVVGRILFIGALALSVASCGGPSPQEAMPTARIVVPAVGQGAGVLVIRDGSAIAFDAGPDSSSALSRALREEGIERAELLVVSHWDLDHVGGLDALIQAGQVEQIAHGGEPVEQWMGARKRAWCAKVPKGCVLVEQGAAKSVLGDFSTEFVRTDPDGATDNERSLVTRLVDGSGTGLFLAPGDIDTSAEAAILARNIPIDARFLLVGHHGSRGSSSLPFLGAVHPLVAFVQAGRGNDHGHPHVEAMERIREVVPDLRVVSTDGTESVMR